MIVACRLHRCSLGRLLALATALSPASLPAVDLTQAAISRLDNGMTLMVLEEHTFPVVSVQMLYRVGSRNEESGRTGLAHFLEHMAFRATEAFPDTEVASAIYAVGGEWHGYTWLDETTYFATVPREHLDLVLRIEAERMAKLKIPAHQVEAERGAVLSELHGYENDPRTVLKDAVIASSFQQHPYRNNTIGWQSEVEKIEHRDLVDFYRRHYHPANAVLAVVGDISVPEVELRVAELFAALVSRSPTPRPRTVEPVQRGERRVELHGARGSGRFFEMVYRAPAVGDADWPVFLVLQEVLGAGEGVNFAQNEWGVAARAGSRLFGITADLVTWYPPMAQPYVFSIAGSIPEDGVAAVVEAAIEGQLTRLRKEEVAAEELAAARQRVLAELVFDVETTEDAAHQLAYFAGLGVLEALFNLPAAVSKVTARELRRVAQRYLQPHQRTIGWHLAEPVVEHPPGRVGVRRWFGAPSEGSLAATPGTPPEPALLRHLDSGLPVLMQRVAFSPAAYLRVLVATDTTGFPTSTTTHHPVWRHTSLNARFRPAELEEVLRRVREALEAGEPSPPSRVAATADPSRGMQELVRSLLRLEPSPSSRAPVAIVLVGDLDVERAFAVVAEHFSDLAPGPRPAASEQQLERPEARVCVDAPRSQARLGYVVPAPPARHPDHLAWRLLLYVLSHGYEGRLGKEAISRRGLVYAIDSSYDSDGAVAWVSLEMGVDRRKLEATRDLLMRTLADLERRLPSAAELAEAQQHLVGRRQSARQSNEEISAHLVSEWIALGRLRSLGEYVQEVEAVTLEDLHRIVPEFVAGTVTVVEIDD